MFITHSLVDCHPHLRGPVRDFVMTCIVAHCISPVGCIDEFEGCMTCTLHLIRHGRSPIDIQHFIHASVSAHTLMELFTSVKGIIDKGLLSSWVPAVRLTDYIRLPIPHSFHLPIVGWGEQREPPRC